MTSVRAFLSLLHIDTIYHPIHLWIRQLRVFSQGIYSFTFRIALWDLQSSLLLQALVPAWLFPESAPIRIMLPLAVLRLVEYQMVEEVVEEVESNAVHEKKSLGYLMLQMWRDIEGIERYKVLTCFDMNRYKLNTEFYHIAESLLLTFSPRWSSNYWHRGWPNNRVWGGRLLENSTTLEITNGWEIGTKSLEIRRSADVMQTAGVWVITLAQRDAHLTKGSTVCSKKIKGKKINLIRRWEEDTNLVLNALASCEQHLINAWLLEGGHSSTPKQRLPMVIKSAELRIAPSGRKTSCTLTPSELNLESAYPMSQDMFCCADKLYHIGFRCSREGDNRGNLRGVYRLRQKISDSVA